MPASQPAPGARRTGTHLPRARAAPRLRARTGRASARAPPRAGFDHNANRRNPVVETQECCFLPSTSKRCGRNGRAGATQARAAHPYASRSAASRRPAPGVTSTRTAPAGRSPRRTRARAASGEAQGGPAAEKGAGLYMSGWGGRGARGSRPQSAGREDAWEFSAACPDSTGSGTRRVQRYRRGGGEGGYRATLSSTK